jgi:hypothetical protein
MLKWTMFTAIILLVPRTATAAVRYVTTTGTGDCMTWTTACSLTTALDQPPSGDEIWVKAGTYSTGGQPFVLANGVKVIGGFAGTETSPSQSNPTNNVTVLDGGLSAPCATNINATVGSLPAILRGFTLRNGRDTDDEGGGLVLDNSSALIVNCMIEENSAGHLGGAVAIRGAGSPQFINCIFHKNGRAAGAPRNNTAGGAVFIRDGTPLFVNCLFDANHAEQAGAVAVMGGSATFVHCTFAQNNTMYQRGGAIFDPDGRVTLKNSIVWSNTKDPDGPGGQASVADQILTDLNGTTVATSSDVEGGWSMGSNNLNTDPLFSNPAVSDYKLLASSPCVNAGDNAALPLDTADLDWDGDTIEPIPKDLAGATRKKFLIVDMGAYECQQAGQ